MNVLCVQQKNSWKRRLYCENSRTLSFFLSIYLFLVATNTVDLFGHWSISRYFFTTQKSVECFEHHVLFFFKFGGDFNTSDS